MTQSPTRPPLPPELDPRGPGARPALGRRRRGLLFWLSSVLAVAVVGVSLAGYVAYRYYDGRLGRVDFRQLLPGHVVPAAARNGAENFLLIGSDTRSAPGTQGYQAPKGSPDYVVGQRSDTVILVHLPAGNGKPLVVSFPRDSWIQIPSFTDPRSHVRYPAHYAKLNAAFSEGGPALLIATLENLSHVRIDHFVEIDFAGFKNMVNALGGVTVCVRTTRHDRNSGDFLTAGTHHINGKQALSFVRDRYQFANGDLTRIKDQQYFLSVVMHKVESAGTLANPFKLNAFLSALTGAVTVDSGLSINDLRTLATRLHGLSTSAVQFTTLPYSNIGYYVDGQDAVQLDPARDAVLFDELRGVTPPAVPTVPLAPGKVTVTVFNAAGLPSLAAHTTTALTAAGFHASVGGDAGSGAATTVVEYSAGSAAAARTLSTALPGSRLREVGGLGGTLKLLVGSDYHGVRAVRVAGSHARPKQLHTQSAAASAASCAP